MLPARTFSGDVCLTEFPVFLLTFCIHYKCEKLYMYISIAENAIASIMQYLLSQAGSIQLHFHCNYIFRGGWVGKGGRDNMHPTQIRHTHGSMVVQAVHKEVTSQLSALTTSTVSIPSFLLQGQQAQSASRKVLFKVIYMNPFTEEFTFTEVLCKQLVTNKGWLKPQKISSR